MFAALTIWLGGCTPSHVPVVDRYGASAALAPVTRGAHVVQKGDTLYSIAWRYGWDFRQLAEANGIRPPYTIYPGQEIRLDGKPGTDPRTPPRTASSSSSSGTKSPATTSGTGTTAAAKTTPRPAPATTGAATAGDPVWRWPADGPLLSSFRQGVAGRQGILLGGQPGAPVRAAAAGIVVYRGSGLTGYGNLLIIKHDERWLSAYAHNREMLVREGQQVKAGEQIATLGDTGAARAQLHFEVRRDGTAIDPVSVLPPR